MNERLARETQALERSWAGQSADRLRDYLVAGVEDPRLNLQSIFSRHAILWDMAGARFARLMEQEYRFSAALNWLAGLSAQNPEAETFAAVLDALSRRSDNAEGLEVPAFLSRVFGALPCEADGVRVPNYIEAFLRSQSNVPDTFCRLWREALGSAGSIGSARLRVLEPACGSANDYRAIRACGLGALVEYTGFDLCRANIENARAMFPGAHFEPGNVFEIAVADGSFDVCYFHDLLEHLSLEGLETAIAEMCRVTAGGICAGFFNMEEVPAHVERPLGDYHWNTLSRSQIEAAFAARGFEGQAFAAPRFLRDRVGCPYAHNPNAWTLWLKRIR